MNFRPMLAAEADLERLQFPLFASPKLDGIRASVVDGKLLTRTLKEVPNRAVFNLLSTPHREGLDGELIVGDPMAHDVYRTTVSGIMSREGNPEFTYYVFDLHNEDGGWDMRYRRLKTLYGEHVGIRVLQHSLIRNDDELLTYEQEHVEMGYEGVILRSPHAPYKHGRSTAREGYLLKLKRFKDSEAVVLSIIEEMHNANEAKTNALGRTERSSHKDNKVGKGRMGALLVRDMYSGVEFQIGTGFTDTDKTWWWAQRDSASLPIVKYKSFPIGVKNLPRHPVYLGIRHPGDLDEKARA